MRQIIIKKVTIISFLIIVPAIASVYIFTIYRDSMNKLAQSRSRQLEQNVLRHKLIRLTPHPRRGVRFIQNTHATNAMADFQGSLYAATTGGLLKLNDAGEVEKHFTVLDGLPESELTTLAKFNAVLAIGTQNRGVVFFDGQNFNELQLDDRRLKGVTELKVNSGNLLIGTARDGLLTFDGTAVRQVRSFGELGGAVATIGVEDGEMYVGTFDRGLWLQRDGGWKNLTTADGLQSNRIVGIAKLNNQVIVGSDFGISILDRAGLRPLDVIPLLSDVLQTDMGIELATEDGRRFSYSGRLVEAAKLKDIEKMRLSLVNDSLFALTNRGVFREGQRLKSDTRDQLSSNFVTSIAFDEKGNIWVGTFRHGVDVFTESGRKIKSILSDEVREINSIGSVDGEIRAATSKGLFSIGENSSVAPLRRGSVMHFSNDLIATSEGLWVGERLLTNVHGLPSANAFATHNSGGREFVGTIAGLAELGGAIVKKTFTDANSGLTNNWVTAVHSVGERIFIGTYGGGVCELDAAGDVAHVAKSGKFAVNPNAMFSSGSLLFVGGMDGLRTMDLTSGEWRIFTEGLPAPGVFSITENNGNIYVSTTSGIAVFDRGYFSAEQGE